MLEEKGMGGPMTPRILLAVTVIGLLGASAVRAETQLTDIALNAVGGLNGLALHCKYVDVSAEIRKEAASTLPKARQYGEAFETATNNAFLDAKRTGKACPDKASFKKEVASAIGLMKGAFGKP